MILPCILAGAIDAAGAAPGDGAASGAPAQASSTLSGPASTADATSDWRLAVRVVPPLSRWGVGEARNLNYPGPSRFKPLAAAWGGFAVGAVAPSRLWLEGSVFMLVAMAGNGWETTFRAGYELFSPPKAGTWTVSLPVYGGYRYANLPYSIPTDGYNFTEDMSLLLVGARLVLTRSFRTNGIDLGLDFSGALPIARAEPARYWRQETDFWLDAAIVIGWSAGL
jgi:hypothetical protein